MSVLWNLINWSLTVNTSIEGSIVGKFHLITWQRWKKKLTLIKINFRSFLVKTIIIFPLFALVAIILWGIHIVEKLLWSVSWQVLGKALLLKWAVCWIGCCCKQVFLQHHVNWLNAQSVDPFIFASVPHISQRYEPCAVLFMGGSNIPGKEKEKSDF